MTTVDEYGWIEKGCRVVVVTEGAHGSKVQQDTVTNLTERHVTTEKSGRFLRRNMRPVGKHEYDPTLVRVLRPDDPYIGEVRARIRVRNIGRLAAKAASQFNGDIPAALAVLNEIEKAVAAARATITTEGK